MPTERAFIEAIHADPTADAPRLIFADWLEERGDERAELVRGETELARVPLTDERYPELRQRVAELRTRIDAEWSIAVAFRQIRTIDDLVYYLRWFHRSLNSEPVLDRRTLRRLPKDLPRGLATIYRELGELFGGGSDLFGKQDALMPPGRLRRIGGMIEFAWENQGNWSARCAPGEDDLPVYSNAEDAWNSPAKGFQKVCDSLNHFLITLCLQEAVMSAPLLVSFNQIPAARIRGQSGPKVLKVAHRPLWLSGHFVSGEPTHNFYDVPGKNALVMDWAGLWLASHSSAGTKVIRRGLKYDKITDEAE